MSASLDCLRQNLGHALTQSAALILGAFCPPDGILLQGGTIALGFAPTSETAGWRLEHGRQDESRGQTCRADARNGGDAIIGGIGSTFATAMVLLA